MSKVYDRVTQKSRSMFTLIGLYVFYLLKLTTNICRSTKAGKA